MESRECIYLMFGAGTGWVAVCGGEIRCHRTYPVRVSEGRLGLEDTRIHRIVGGKTEI